MTIYSLGNGNLKDSNKASKRMKKMLLLDLNLVAVFYLNINVK